MKCSVCDKQITQLQNRNRTRCNSCNTKIRRYRNKAAAIEYLGGKCVDCNFSGHQSAFDFHHLKNKSFTIGAVANKSWDVIKEELDKCILLCRNCHSIRHSTRDDLRLIAEVDKYKGKLLG